MRLGRWWAVIGLAAAGCLQTDEPNLNYFRRPEPLINPAALTPASTETAARVDCVGRKLLAANPQIGARPQFHTVGAPHAEVFHRGTTDIFITEGLVQNCPDDSQLAAILSIELGKLVRDREARVPGEIRTKEILPPIDSRYGNDDMMGGTTDRSNTRQWEELDRERKTRRRPPLPDAYFLAKDYLRAAGYDPAAMNAAEPLLRDAASRNLLEKQLSPSVAPHPGSGPIPDMTPPPGVTPIRDLPAPPPGNFPAPNTTSPPPGVTPLP
ncbi:MAG: hypothetical protein K1X57_08190 [Gemmataceae bacterium]|nr:hypothetical protein [Gemmataceae bacterium]